MRIFSNRKRAFAAGPYPTEWLPRGEHPQPWTPRPAPPIEVGEQSFTHVLAPVHDVFVAERTADVAPGRAPLPSPEAALANVKGYCYFLDADIVGITRLEPADWSGAALTGHTHAIAIVISHGRPVEPDEPGSAWIA